MRQTGYMESTEGYLKWPRQHAYEPFSNCSGTNLAMTVPTAVTFGEYPTHYQSNRGISRFASNFPLNGFSKLEQSGYGDPINVFRDARSPVIIESGSTKGRMAGRPSPKTRNCASMPLPPSCFERILVPANVSRIRA